MANLTIDQLTEIITPSVQTEFWVKDELANPKDRRFSIPSLLDVVKADLGSAAQSETTEFAPAFTPATKVVYVSKDGSGTNDGTTPTSPFDTFTDAFTAANALVKPVAVVCLDAGTYTENFTVFQDTHLFAPLAEVAGAIVLEKGASVTIDRHTATADSQILLSKSGDEQSSYRCRISDGRAFELVTNIRNATNNSILFVKADIVYIGTFGRGIQDYAGGTSGHIHFSIGDIYLQGNSSFGIDAANNSDIIGYVDHILKIAGPSGTVAIRLGNSNAVAKIVAAEVITDVSYDVTAGAELWLNCLKISGTQTGDAVVPWSNHNTQVDVDGFIKIIP